MEVPAVKSITTNSTFDSWLEFQHSLKKYSEDNHVEFVVSASKPVAWGANNKLLQPGEQPYGDHLKYKYDTYLCKQGPTRKSESTGIRAVQMYFNFLSSFL